LIGATDESEKEEHQVASRRNWVLAPEANNPAQTVLCNLSRDTEKSICHLFTPPVQFLLLELGLNTLICG
jgi:hypothetical protein